MRAECRVGVNVIEPFRADIADVCMFGLQRCDGCGELQYTYWLGDCAGNFECMFCGKMEAQVYGPVYVVNTLSSEHLLDFVISEAIRDNRREMMKRAIQES